MNDRQIACFLEAVKERNFTKVAEKLYLTQPGVSRMIATLEKELNTKLFARSAHKTLELTESGKLYYEMFEKCRREFEETKRKSELIQRENTDITTLKFGYVRGWSITGFYPLMLDALQEEFPYLNVDLESHSYERLYDLLYSGNLDFILTMNFPEMEKLHSDLEVMEICQVPQAVIYPKEFGTKKDIADFQYFSFQSADTYHQPVYLSSSCFFRPPWGRSSRCGGRRPPPVRCKAATGGRTARSRQILSCTESGPHRSRLRHRNSREPAHR